MITPIDRKKGRVPTNQEIADKLNETIELVLDLKANLMAMYIMFGAEPGEPIDPGAIKRKAS